MKGVDAERQSLQSRAAASSKPAVSPGNEREWVRECLTALTILALATASALALRSGVSAASLAMIYLLGVVATALRCRREVSVMASFIAVGVFDFFCVPPYFTLRVASYDDVITFAAMLAVALVISTQTA